MLVLRPGALGDTLLAVPALRALRRAFGTVTLAAHPATARLLASIGEVDRGVAFEDAPQEHDDVVVAWMAARFAPSHATLVAPSRPSDATHCAVHLLHSLAPLGIDLSFDDHAFELRPMVSDEILVHPGSGSPAKNWPVERFAEVIGALPVPIGLILGEADETADAMLDKAYPRLCRRPLGVLAERLAGCRAYLGNDSGISHLAGLSGARTVVMFGPTDPRVWRPLGPRVSVLGFDASAATVVEELLGRGG